MKGKWMKIVRQYTIITLGISMMAVALQKNKKQIENRTEK